VYITQNILFSNLPQKCANNCTQKSSTIQHIHDTGSWYWLDRDHPRINVCLYRRTHKKQLTPQTYTAVNPPKYVKVVWLIEAQYMEIMLYFYSIYMPTSINMVACDWTESPHPYQKETVYMYFQAQELYICILNQNMARIM
jgi:hypothetical protein